jgi:hypothetical protein
MTTQPHPQNNEFPILENINIVSDSYLEIA